MIKAHFESTVRQLKSHSTSLSKKNIFVDKPWTIIDEDNEVQRLVFKKDKSLIMSKNGEVNYGSWDYLPEARSIVINRIKDSILCNEAYIDEGVMILQLDGTSNQFFKLANANVIPDLDINKYLRNKRYEKFQISAVKLVDGKLLEVCTDGWDFIEIGLPVMIDANKVADGNYHLENSNTYYEVADGIIIQIRAAIVYTNPEGVQITVNERTNNNPSKGDSVFINNMIATDQTINLSRLKRLIINDGKILTLQHKNIVFGTYHNSNLINLFITIAVVLTTFIIIFKVIF